MVSEREDLASPKYAGSNPLTGISGLTRSHLHIIVVALVIGTTGFASPKYTGFKLLTGIFGLTRPCLSFHCVVEGSSRGRSDICRFQGFTPKWVFLRPRNQTTFSTQLRGQKTTPHFKISTSRLIGWTINQLDIEVVANYQLLDTPFNMIGESTIRG